MRLSKLAVGCLSMLLLAGVALGQQKYELKCRMRPGARFSFEQMQDMKQNMTITAENGMSQPGQQSNHMERRGTVEVLAVGADGSASSLRISFDKTCTNKMEMMGQSQNINFPLAGETLTISRDAAGQLQHDFKGQLDPMVTNELNGYLESSTPFFPKQPVSVGDQWDGDTAALTRAVGLNPTDPVRMTCKFTGVKEVSGRPAAVVGMVSSFSKSGQPAIQSEVTGGGMIDLENGVVLESDTATKFTMNGTQEMNGMKLKVTGQGTSIMHSSQKPLGGGMAMAPATPGMLSTPAAPAPGNPLGAPAASYAGTFKDDRITVELTTAAGKYNGRIVMGAQSFPLTASDNAGKLDGKFETQGTSYDFIATLDAAGSTLTLVTGGTTYTLKKQVTAVNPLGIR